MFQVLNMNVVLALPASAKSPTASNYQVLMDISTLFALGINVNWQKKKQMLAKSNLTIRTES